jgi:hypothetical protein
VKIPVILEALTSFLHCACCGAHMGSPLSGAIRKTDYGRLTMQRPVFDLACWVVGAPGRF